ncbi:MAG: flagellar hook-basal body complex protein [Clostridium sp.]|uniref:flagellar hook-basal body complex protein n=1 Tax=Clostridium sp. TaxID=1506 RepID=UPI003D6CBBD5
MLRSFYSGVSGLKVNQVKLDVIGNNIANVGTTAFKSSRVRFKDMVSQSVNESGAPGTSQGGVNPKQVGLGVQVSGIDTMVGQGAMQPTSRTLDVAIDGEGYLMVAKGKVPDTNADGITLGTDNVVDDPNGVELFYTRDGALTLDKSGNLLNSDGLRILGYAVKEGANISLAYSGGAATPKFVDANKALTTETTLIPLVIPEKIEDPNDATKTLRVISYSIEKDGQIKAVLEDGKVSVLGQIATSSFKNAAGLSKVGGNLFKNTSNSGEAVVRSGIGTDPDEDNSDAYGDVLSQMLEMSNVDLAEQFTDMIIAQRAFQASGKSITTGDEILQELIGLKR